MVTEQTQLLEFLRDQFPEKPKHWAKALLTHRAVLVEDRVVTRYDAPLKRGQIVRIIRSGAAALLYEDKDLLVVDKAAGLLSVATDQEKEHTAYRLWTVFVRRSTPNGRLFVVHRLDRDTSGVLLFAKSQAMKQALQDHWNELVSLRGYTAVTEGLWAEKSGCLQSWLKETRTRVVYASSTAGDGLRAVTRYQVQAERPGYSLLRLQLETGRKNQIRVQMQDAGHPVAGDPKYGARTNPLGRLGLHADTLALTHPFSGQPLCFTAPLPPPFRKVFPRLPETWPSPDRHK